MIKTQEKFKIRMLDDTLTAVKNDILNDRLSLPYSFDQKIDSSSFIRHTFDNMEGDNVTLTSEKILYDEESCSKFNEYTDISDDFQHEIIEQLKNGKLKSPFIAETRMDTTGVRKEITFSLNDDGTVLIETNSFKTSIISYKLKKEKMSRIESRRGMKKFGLGKEKNNSVVTMVSTEDVYITTPDGVPIGENNIKIPKKKKDSGRDASTLSFADMFKNPYKPKIKNENEPGNKFVFKKKERKNSILVRNLPQDIEEDEVRDIFKEYGRIRNVKVLKYYAETKAFVNYYLENEAESAIEHMNGHRMNHVVLAVDFSRPKR